MQFDRKTMGVFHQKQNRQWVPRFEPVRRIRDDFGLTIKQAARNEFEAIMDFGVEQNGSDEK